MDRVRSLLTVLSLFLFPARLGVSLFEDQRYQYCDTFFVYLIDENRPSADAVTDAIKSLGERYQISDLKSTDGLFNAVTIRSPYDSSGMDITYLTGGEVREQVEELMTDFKTISLVGDDHQKLSKIDKANARLDIFHFEQVSDSDDLEMIDPGGLLLVMQKLNELCDGVGLDPQSKTLI